MPAEPTAVPPTAKPDEPEATAVTRGTHSGTGARPGVFKGPVAGDGGIWAIFPRLRSACP